MLLIILIAHSITLATSFSISSIATNINVKGGGLYYLISRSLGSELGGSMGIQLFLAQTISIAFYCIAFAKAVSNSFAYFGVMIPELQIALVSFIFFWILAYIGADFVIKLQYIILGIICLSFLSIFFAQNRAPTPQEFFGVGGVMIPFWVAFAMFFPAVTGIDAGVALSGDLKNPRKSLVKGTFSAVIVTFVFYSAIVAKYFYSADLQALSTNEFIVQHISAVPFLIILGVLMTTSSSALSYLMGAPRTLRALAEDKVFSKHFLFLTRSIGKSPEPRVAMFITLFVGIGVIMSGDLFFVSQLVALFFLTVYGWINGAALLEKISKNPSFRPSFNAPAWVSFYGMVMCYLVMFLFNPLIMLVCILFQFLIFFLLGRSKTSSKLESVWSGVLFQLFRTILDHIETQDKTKKNWRPTIVSFCINQSSISPMANLIDWISGTRGINKLYYLVTRRFDTYEIERNKIQDDLKTYAKEYELELYPKVVLCSNYLDSMRSIMQSESLGNLPLNTLAIDFDERFILDQTLNIATSLGKNVIILRSISGFADFRKIDVWWKDEKNGNMMILLAYLIMHSKRWRDEDATIRIYKIVNNDKEQDHFEKLLKAMVKESRIDNVIVEVIKRKRRKVKDIIFEYSHNSDLVIQGIPMTEKSKATKSLVKDIKKHTDGLKATLLVSSVKKIDLTIN